MRVGITVDDPDTVVDEARRAEALGFDYLGCGEHLFFHGPTPNSFAMLAAAAAVTSRIRLVTSIALLPLYPAAVVAKMASVIDCISDGRFELGVGAGGEFPPEFAAASVDVRTRFRRLDEGIEVIRRLFAGGSVTFEGTYARLSGLALDPPPRRPGGPPIWLGGRKNGALRRVGRYADVWMPYMVDPEQMRVGLAKVRSAAADNERSADAVSAALFAWAAVDVDSSWARSTGVGAVSAAYSQDFSPLADRYLLIGSPDAVVERLAQFRSAGVDTVIIQIAADSAEHRSRIVETFASRVLPIVRDL